MEGLGEAIFKAGICFAIVGVLVMAAVGYGVFRLGRCLGWW